MDVTPLVKKGQQIIQSYADGLFKVSGVSYHGAITIMPDAVVAWPVSSPHPEALNVEDFNFFANLAERIDILIIGTGGRHLLLPQDILLPVKRMKINTESMDTGAACRTYNVLMAEGRRVAAALLPVQAADKG